MRIKSYARALRNKARFALFKLRTAFSDKKKFECPICGYRGALMDVHPSTGIRKHAQCPKCGALERHRLQHLAITEALRGRDRSRLKMLHFAPERCFRPLFAAQFGSYTTADLNMEGVDHHVDIRDLPFEDEAFDFVFASIVLDYIPDDDKAIREIRRVLKPDGLAILPVALVCDKTVEYSEPNPYEAYHVRASGMDYFDRYEKHFSKVERVSSGSFPDKYQLFIYEDRTLWPNKQSPLRPFVPGEKHVNIVPVCHV